MIVDSAAADIVYTNFFSGVHGSYLKKSIENAGFQPDELPEGDLRKMNFGSDRKSKVKAWRDVWSAGQGVGNIDDIPSARELVLRMEQEYQHALHELGVA